MISVVIPVYNAAKYIRPAVESILRQDLAPTEIIVVDDGSNDGTRDIIHGYTRRHPTLRLIEAAHGGGSRALNIGIEAAKSEWVAVMHGDDIALPQRLRRQLDAARQHPEVVVWGTHAYLMSTDGCILGVSRFGPRSVEEFNRIWSAGRDVLVLHPSAMLRREVVLRVGGYDPGITTAEDLDLFMRMAHHGPVVTVPEPLLQYRLHADTNTMRRFFVMQEESRYIRARRRAELMNRSIGALDEFRRENSRRASYRKAAEQVTDAGCYCYRKAAMLYGQRKLVPSASYLSAALMLNPIYAATKLWRQLFSPSARTLLRKAESAALPQDLAEASRTGSSRRSCS